MNSLGKKKQPTYMITRFFEPKYYKIAVSVTVMKKK